MDDDISTYEKLTGNPIVKSELFLEVFASHSTLILKNALIIDSNSSENLNSFPLRADPNKIGRYFTNIEIPQNDFYLEFRGLDSIQNLQVSRINEHIFSPSVIIMSCISDSQILFPGEKLNFTVEIINTGEEQNFEFEAIYNSDFSINISKLHLAFTRSNNSISIPIQVFAKESIKFGVKLQGEFFLSDFKGKKIQFLEFEFILRPFKYDIWSPFCKVSENYLRNCDLSNINESKYDNLDWSANINFKDRGSGVYNIKFLAHANNGSVIKFSWDNEKNSDDSRIRELIRPQSGWKQKDSQPDIMYSLNIFQKCTIPYIEIIFQDQWDFEQICYVGTKQAGTRIGAVLSECLSKSTPGKGIVVESSFSFWGLIAILLSLIVIICVILLCILLIVSRGKKKHINRHESEVLERMEQHSLVESVPLGDISVDQNVSIGPIQHENEVHFYTPAQNPNSNITEPIGFRPLYPT